MVPKGDFTSQELEFEDPPNLSEDIDMLLEHECKPFMICIANKDWASLNAIWRRVNAWDSNNFYKVVDTLVKINEEEGLRHFLSPRNEFINLFYQPKFLQQMLEENPNANEQITE